ncbi:MAG: tRNA uridine-5-carboxymethylaminomethyl(34) synthesis enzyme MnmG [Treponema sp.]|nr:tRNA uridine-5-carboxymethylaminomethyl(34) synthesis enzyme MnmG [Treponema sp.]
MAGFYEDYDVAVVGGGHAGIEAALAAAKMGLKTILITQTIDSIGRMSCNPSIGGIAKGNIAREVDALGGVMGHLIDASMIQFRLLNKSRGPAVQAPRAQADKLLYSQLARQMIEKQPGLTLLQDTVVDLEAVESTELLPPKAESNPDKEQEPLPGQRLGSSAVADGKFRLKLVAVVTERGRRIPVRSAILTTGTFLGGKIFIGNYDAPCGRLGEPGTQGITEALNRLGFTTGRLKTGTPPRVLKSSIDFSQLEEQPGDTEIIPFSFDNETVERPMVSCHLVYTNEETHQLIRGNIGSSPLYSGKISGVGPRYCPSIEDKVMRFAERERHQLFVEPEGLTTDEMYINGFSSSLPEEIQDKFMRTLPGFADAVMSRPGYAVEYDFIDPTQLFPSLETKLVAGLFTAGQINGTSGYEEAAGQGLVAGINGALYAKSHRELCGPLQSADNNELVKAVPSYQPLVLERSEAYIGVLIDDLVTLGTREPYRMFTARAEYRLKLRHDTADIRLCEKGYQVGLNPAWRFQRVQEKLALQQEIIALLAKNPKAQNPGYPEAIWDAALIDIKYQHYIDKQDRRVEKMHRMEHARIPADFDYGAIPSLSAESRQKLERVRPTTLGQASRISGIRNSDIMLLMVYLK